MLVCRCHRLRAGHQQIWIAEHCFFKRDPCHPWWQGLCLERIPPQRGHRIRRCRYRNCSALGTPSSLQQFRRCASQTPRIAVLDTRSRDPWRWVRQKLAQFPVRFRSPAIARSLRVIWSDVTRTMSRSSRESTAIFYKDVDSLPVRRCPDESNKIGPPFIAPAKGVRHRFPVQTPFIEIGGTGTSQRHALGRHFKHMTRYPCDLGLSDPVTRITRQVDQCEGA